MDDIRELWSETPNHNWSALQKTLNAHRGKAQGISDALARYEKYRAESEAIHR